MNAGRKLVAWPAAVAQPCGAAFAAVVLVLTACASTSILHDGDLTLPDGRVLNSARMRLRSARGERTLSLWYRTPEQITDNCQAIEAEAKGIWEQYLQAEADRTAARLVQIVPEDSTFVSVGFVLKRDGKGGRSHNFGICD